MSTIQPIGKKPVTAPSRLARSDMPAGMVKMTISTRLATTNAVIAATGALTLLDAISTRRRGGSLHPQRHMKKHLLVQVGAKGGCRHEHVLVMQGDSILTCIAVVVAALLIGSAAVVAGSAQEAVAKRLIDTAVVVGL